MAQSCSNEGPGASERGRRSNYQHTTVRASELPVFFVCLPCASNMNYNNKTWKYRKKRMKENKANDKSKPLRIKSCARERNAGEIKS